jgi:hypothetical protein
MPAGKAKRSTYSTTVASQSWESLCPPIKCRKTSARDQEDKCLSASDMPWHERDVKRLESNVLFYTGRPVAVPARIAPPPRLLAPELDLLYTAAYVGLDHVPVRFIRVSTALLCVYVQHFAACKFQHNLVHDNQRRLHSLHHQHSCLFII